MNRSDFLRDIYQNQKEIMESGYSSRIKDKMLSSLMDMMEKDFRIPSRYDRGYERQNPFIWSVYKEIADNRKQLYNHK